MYMQSVLELTESKITNANAANKNKQNCSDDSLDRITKFHRSYIYTMHSNAKGIAQSDFQIQNLNMVFRFGSKHEHGSHFHGNLS